MIIALFVVVIVVVSSYSKLLCGIIGELAAAVYLAGI